MFQFGAPLGLLGMMTPFTWMFLSSFEKLRKVMLQRSSLMSLIRPEYHAFFESAFCSDMRLFGYLQKRPQVERECLLIFPNSMERNNSQLRP